MKLLILALLGAIYTLQFLFILAMTYSVAKNGMIKPKEYQGLYICRRGSARTCLVYLILFTFAELVLVAGVVCF